MSTPAGAPSNGTSPGAASPDRQNKGKGKIPVSSPDVSMETDEGDEDDEDDEDYEMEEDEDDEDDEDPEINPSAILSGGRRTRGIKVDYTSPEALKKAGLKPESEEEDDDDDAGKRGNE